ncbi:predicted protein [Postia placenta Mad-698-R]|nr:predicted protein [Postia placenta Mad-698-R]
MPGADQLAPENQVRRHPALPPLTFGVMMTHLRIDQELIGVSAFSSVDGKRAVVVDIVKVLCVSGAIERKCVIVFCGDGGFKVPRDNDFVHTPGIIFIFTTGYVRALKDELWLGLCFGPSSLNHIRLNRHVAYTLTYETYETRWLADDAVGKGTSPSSSSSLSGKSASSSPSGRKREADKKCGSNVGRFRLIVHHDVRGREEDDGSWPEIPVPFRLWGSGAAVRPNNPTSCAVAGVTQLMG